MPAANLKNLVRRHAELGIILIAVLLIFAFSVSSGGNWANFYNISTIVQVTATLGLMTLGVALVIATGEIDISVGSTFGICSLVYLWLSLRIDPAFAMLAAVAIGILIGWFNGILVTKTGTPSLIVTLGSLMIFRGLAIALTSGFAFSIPYKARNGLSYFILGGGEIFGLNTAIIWLVLALIVLTIMLKYMRWGNRLLATGGSERALARAACERIVSSCRLLFCVARSLHLAAFSKLVSLVLPTVPWDVLWNCKLSLPVSSAAACLQAAAFHWSARSLVPSCCLRSNPTWS